MSDEKFPTHFHQASKAKKVELIHDGLRYLASQAMDMERNTSVLKGWVQIMPAYIQEGYANRMNIEELLDSVVSLSDSIDLMTSQGIELTEAIQKLEQYLEATKTP